MRIEIPQIFWHGNRDRIMSIDFYPNSNYLVTCGAEADDKMWIKFWEIEDHSVEESNNDTTNANNNPFKTNKPNPFLNEDSMLIDDGNVPNNQGNGNGNVNMTKIWPKFLYDISGAHTATVNVVRFSPNGWFLASGGDDSAIVIWVQKSRPVEFGSTIEKISWSNHKILRGHLSDIYDLCWSPDSKFLISGSVDNSSIIWNLEKAKGIQKMTDHSHFVQGVSWDPRNKFVVTMSSDKSARIYKNCDLKQETKFYFLNMIKKNILQAKENSNEDLMQVDRDRDLPKKEKLTNLHTNQHYYFADESQCPSFFRRHAWSPDGSICLLSAGINKDETGQSEHVVWGLSRKDMTKPLFLLPTLDKSATCIRFCPILFEKENLMGNSSTPELIDLPYKMVFAIGTIDSIFIYDTQNICPKYAITNIHYQPITDLAWKGSSILAASSSDGYITFCVFDKDELGKPEEIEKIPENAKYAYSTYSKVEYSQNILHIHNLNNSARIVKKKKSLANAELPSSGTLSNENSNKCESEDNINVNVNVNVNTAINQQQQEIIPDVIVDIENISSVNTAINVINNPNNQNMVNNTESNINVPQSRRRITPIFIQK